MPFPRSSTFFACVALLVSGTAFAQAHLESQFPAANSTVPNVKELRLHFSEGVEGQFSKASITSTLASGKTMVEAVANIATAVDDRNTLIITPAAPLAAGNYKVEWHAVALDANKSEGSYKFKVGP